MEDDVESTLAGLERRLRALQSELDEERAEPVPAVPAAPDAPPAPAPAPAAVEDALAHFDAALQRATRELSTAWDQALAAARGAGEGGIVRGEVALEARVTLAGLCELHRALTAIPEVGEITLRAYAGGHAALDLDVRQPVALAGALRALLPIAVLDARPGRLAIALD